MRSAYTQAMEYLYRFCVVICVVSVVVMTCLIFTGVIMRNGFTMGARFAEPLSIFFAVQLTMYGAAACYRAHVHLRLQVFVRMLPLRAQHYNEIFVHLMMGEHEKQLLLTASVIGKQVPLRLLRLVETLSPGHPSRGVEQHDRLALGIAVEARTGDSKPEQRRDREHQQVRPRVPEALHEHPRARFLDGFLPEERRHDRDLAVAHAQALQQEQHARQPRETGGDPGSGELREAHTE